MARRKLASVSTLTRAVASLTDEPDDVWAAALSTLARAYDDEDHAAGRTCYTHDCRTCGGPPNQNGTT